MITPPLIRVLVRRLHRQATVRAGQENQVFRVAYQNIWRYSIIHYLKNEHSEVSIAEKCLVSGSFCFPYWSVLTHCVIWIHSFTLESLHGLNLINLQHYSDS